MSVFNIKIQGHFDWEFETVLWDLDGTLSGSGQPNTKITPLSNLNSRYCSQITDGWDLGFPASQCTDQAHFQRLSFEEANGDFGGVSEDIMGITMNLNNENDDAPNHITAQVS